MVARLRSNGAFGTITDNPLLIGATAMNSSALANLIAVTGSDFAVITLDPNRIYGAPEIIHVTAHTASATSATITRGQEGSTARQHTSGTQWVNGPTVQDFWGGGGTLYGAQTIDVAPAFTNGIQLDGSPPGANDFTGYAQAWTNTGNLELVTFGTLPTMTFKHYATNNAGRWDFYYGTNGALRAWSLIAGDITYGDSAHALSGYITGNGGATVTLNANSGTGRSQGSSSTNDMAGYITINTGTGTASGDQFSVAYKRGYTQNLVSVTLTASSTFVGTPLLSASDSTGFTVYSASAQTASSTYRIYYQAILCTTVF